MSTLKIKKLHENAIIPSKPKDDPDSAGYDLYAHSFVELRYGDNGKYEKFPITDKCFVLTPGERVLVKSGISATIGKGYELQIRSRSGLALNHGVISLNSPGTIDCNYRGDVGVILSNTDLVLSYTITVGDRIAQMVPSEVPILDGLEIVDDLDETSRGAGGLGHSGK